MIRQNVGLEIRSQESSTFRLDGAGKRCSGAESERGRNCRKLVAQRGLSRIGGEKRISQHLSGFGQHMSATSELP